MNNLKEKSRRATDTSKLNYAVSENTVVLSNYLGKTGNGKPAQFSSWGTSFRGDDEPLPSMFRTRSQGSKIVRTLQARFDPSSATTGFSSYLNVVLFLMLVAGAALHYSTAVPPVAKDAQAPIATAVSVSTSTATGNEASQTESMTLTPPSIAEAEEWSKTLQTFKRLLAEQDASQPPQTKRVDSERPLGQFEAWLNAKPR